MKRIISLLLMLALLLGCAVLPAAADAPAAQKTSEQGIQFIKSQEGFSSHKHYDYSQYSIGYGTACGAGDYPNGITVEQADGLLRKALEPVEDKVTKFAETNHLPLSQPQFDALVSFTYNLGHSWLSGCRLSRLLIAGNFTAGDFVNALGVWCHAGSSFLSGLAKRRVRESQMFLYGDYTGTNSTTYCWLRLNANGGSVDADVFYYPKGAAYGTLPNCTCSGKTFAGWTVDGAVLSKDAAVERDLTVTAKWQTGKPAAEVFSDVRANQWFYEYVDTLYNSGIISGYENGQFRPTGTVKLGEALKMVFLVCGEKEQPATKAHWAGGYGNLAVKKGIFTQSTLPDLNCVLCRCVLAKIIAKEKKLPVGKSESGVFADCTDAYCVALYRAGIADGRMNEKGARCFFPYDAVTRAELCAMLYRLKK